MAWTTGITVTFTYDANGNEVAGSNGLGFAYNAKDQTTSVTGIFGAQLSMGYADSGQAERTSAGGSAYVNSSLGIGSETKSGQTTYYTRTPSGHLISQRTAGGTYYYLFDGLGSVVGMVDASGNIVARYGYDPYGQQVQKRGRDASPSDTSIADGNPFRYTGAYLDATGFYKMGERYYDPARGRFTQLDPLGGGYVYAGNDPINFVDPTGLLQNDGDGLATGLDNGCGCGAGGAEADIRIFDGGDEGWTGRPGTSENPISPGDIPSVPPGTDGVPLGQVVGEGGKVIGRGIRGLGGAIGIHKPDPGEMEPEPIAEGIDGIAHSPPGSGGWPGGFIGGCIECLGGIWPGIFGGKK